MDRCDPRSRPLATNRAAHRAEKISAAYRNPRHRRQGIPGLRCRATPNTANLLSENRPGVTDAGVSLRRLTSRNSLTLKNFFQRGVEDGLGCAVQSACFVRSAIPIASTPDSAAHPRRADRKARRVLETLHGAKRDGARRAGTARWHCPRRPTIVINEQMQESKSVQFDQNHGVLVKHQCSKSG